MFQAQINQGAQALDVNQLIQLWMGYSVNTSGDCTPSAGAGNREIDVAAGDYLYGGTQKTFAGGSVTLDTGDTEPRKDLVVIDGTNSLEVIKGTSAQPLPTDDYEASDWFDTYQPSPDDVNSLDKTVICEVFVDIGDNDTPDTKIQDRRFIKAEFDAVVASSLVTDLLQVDGADIEDKANGDTIWDASARVVRNLEAHADDHQDGGADELNVTGLSGDLADEQDPKPHASEHQNGGVDELDVTGLSGDLADEQDPKPHAGEHKDGGVDELDAAELAGGLGTNGQVLQTDGAATSWADAQGIGGDDVLAYSFVMR